MKIDHRKIKREIIKEVKKHNSVRIFRNQEIETACCVRVGSRKYEIYFSKEISEDPVQEKLILTHELAHIYFLHHRDGVKHAKELLEYIKNDKEKSKILTEFKDNAELNEFLHELVNIIDDIHINDYVFDETEWKYLDIVNSGVNSLSLDMPLWVDQYDDMPREVYYDKVFDLINNDRQKYNELISKLRELMIPFIDKLMNDETDGDSDSSDDSSSSDDSDSTESKSTESDNSEEGEEDSKSSDDTEDEESKGQRSSGTQKSQGSGHSNSSNNQQDKKSEDLNDVDTELNENDRKSMEDKIKSEEENKDKKEKENKVQLTIGSGQTNMVKSSSSNGGANFVPVENVHSIDNDIFNYLKKILGLKYEKDVILTNTYQLTHGISKNLVYQRVPGKTYIRHSLVSFIVDVSGSVDRNLVAAVQNTLKWLYDRDVILPESNVIFVDDEIQKVCRVSEIVPSYSGGGTDLSIALDMKYIPKEVTDVILVTDLGTDINSLNDAWINIKPQISSANLWAVLYGMDSYCQSFLDQALKLKLLIKNRNFKIFS